MNNIQVKQEGIIEYLLEATVFLELNSLNADENCQVVKALYQAVLNFVQQGVATVFGVL